MADASARVRWATVESAPALPGMDERVTHPEFAGIEFVHVRARKLLNEVPAAAGLPFRWTINVYRGCSHDCVYCLGPDTAILMADGRTRRIADVRAGDRVIGTGRDRRYRRYVTTDVLDHWATTKRAYRVTLRDGTQLIASGDHRFLTHRGWKYVTGTQDGRDRRPHLTVDDDLLGTGGFPPGPKRGGDYRRGYLYGVIRGAAPRGERTTDGLDRFGFDTVVEDPRRANGLKAIRVRGGLSEHLRFFLSLDPAITRKRIIDGTALTSSTRLTVTSVEDIGIEMPMYDLTTGTGDFVANGIVSHNCFARPSHAWLKLDPAKDFGSVIVVKVNAVERLRAELRAPSWQGEHIALGTNTDPYQRCEGRYRLTRGVVEALAEAGNRFSILTKGTLVTRDLDVLADAAARGVCTNVSLSIPTLDEELWRASEPGAPHPQARMQTVAALADAGVPAGVMVAPIIPGLSDGPDQLEAVVRAALDAGASAVTPIVLHLRPGVKELVFPWIDELRPELMDRYRELYRRSYAPGDERRRIVDTVRRLVALHGSSPTTRRRTAVVPPGDHRRTGHRGAAPRSDGDDGAGGEQLTLL